MAQEGEFQYYRGSIPADQYNRLVADGTLNPDGTKPGSGFESGMDPLIFPLTVLALRKRLKASFANLRGIFEDKK